jgi:hypothetical protein
MIRNATRSPVIFVYKLEKEKGYKRAATRAKLSASTRGDQAPNIRLFQKFSPTVSNVKYLMSSKNLTVVSTTVSG